jgi:HK97 gp10 family phage protein
MSIDISGDKEVIKALESIGIRKAGNVIRSAIRKEAREARDKIRANAPVHPDDVVKYAKGESKKITKKGTLKRAIKSKDRKPRNGVYQTNVYVDQGKNKKNDAYYWHMVEYGTVNMPAKPFIRPVEASKEQSAERDIKFEFLAGIAKELQKALK